jgi:hypothetical protein
MWVAVALGAAATLAVLAGPADEAAAGTCDGVWVVVDASQLGGGLTTRCAPGDPSSGLDALRAAGHAYAFVPRVPGMVCTIDGRPDPCNGAPSDAYWSYWHAEAGGSWTYASRGAGQRDPAPGSVEGWAFGAGDPPGTAPPAPSGDEAGGDRDGSSDSSGGSGSGSPSGTGSSPGSDGGSGSDGSSGTGGSSGGSAGSDGSSAGGGTGSSETGSTGPESRADGPDDGGPAPDPDDGSSDDADSDGGGLGDGDATGAGSDDDTPDDPSDGDDAVAASRRDALAADASGSPAGEGRVELDRDGADVQAGTAADAADRSPVGLLVAVVLVVAVVATGVLRRRSD